MTTSYSWRYVLAPLARALPRHRARPARARPAATARADPARYDAAALAEWIGELHRRARHPRLRRRRQLARRLPVHAPRARATPGAFARLVNIHSPAFPEVRYSRAPPRCSRSRASRALLARLVRARSAAAGSGQNVHYFDETLEVARGGPRVRRRRSRPPRARGVRPLPRRHDGARGLRRASPRAAARRREASPSRSRCCSSTRDRSAGAAARTATRLHGAHPRRRAGLARRHVALRPRRHARSRRSRGPPLSVLNRRVGKRTDGSRGPRAWRLGDPGGPAQRPWKKTVALKTSCFLASFD